MSKKDITRRDFVKLAGFAGVAFPTAKVVGKIGKENILESEELYGGFLVRQLDNEQPYEVDDSVYERFDQKNEMFARASWDKEWRETVNSADIGALMGANTPGLSREDMSFYMAAWCVATGVGSQGGSIGGVNDGLYNPQQIPGTFTTRNLLSKGLPPWEWKSFGYTDRDVTDMVKTAAKFYGASLVGVAKTDLRWIYSKYYDEAYYNPPTLYRGNIVVEDVDQAEYIENGDFVIPKDVTTVIVMAFEMDYEGHTLEFGPASGATGNGYSKMVFTSACLSEFIRGLGYKAIPAGNSVGLSVPIAIDAGLGEAGRSGILITPKYGPRVRLAKIYTNMPLLHDKPIKFGAVEFCEVCGKCADLCPGNSIFAGPRAWTGNNISNNDGVYKWYNNHEGCLRYWRESGLSCSSCISVCPFNKPEGWLHDATRIMIGAKSGAIDQLLLKLDDASGYGNFPKDKETYKKFYTKRSNFMHIKEG